MSKWEVVYDDNCDGYYVADEEGSLIDWDGCCSHKTAILMAAAPELLQELRNMVMYFQYTDESDGQYEAFNSAKTLLERLEGELK